MRKYVLLALLSLAIPAAAYEKTNEFTLQIHVVNMDAGLINIHIEGDDREFTLKAADKYWLQIGAYNGRWNHDGSLEIQFPYKGRSMHQAFHIISERMAAEAKTPVASATTAARPVQMCTTDSNGHTTCLAVVVCSELLTDKSGRNLCLDARSIDAATLQQIDKCTSR
ncbi:MAG: hypothetical protein WA188_17530 [Terriglobales bacterium]